MNKLLKLLAVLAWLAAIGLMLAACLEHESPPTYIPIYGENGGNKGE
ncbi:MAG: hypothetical protein PHG73_01340 [Pygmaiobacter sp.]|nr:hypothetical protein [Pygmaiobacter sp.]